MDVVAKTHRSEGWWAVEVPEIPGLFTQARRLDQVPQMVQDAGAMLGHTKLAVTVDVVLNTQDALAVKNAPTQFERLREAETAAASAPRFAPKRQTAPVTVDPRRAVVTLEQTTWEGDTLGPIWGSWQQ